MTHPSVPYYRIDPHDLGRPERPHPPASLTVRQRIRAEGHTHMEVEVARTAVEAYRRAVEAPRMSEPGGADPKRYKGITAYEIVRARVRGWRRQVKVMALVVAMARERGIDASREKDRA